MSRKKNIAWSSKRKQAFLLSCLYSALLLCGCQKRPVPEQSKEELTEANSDQYAEKEKQPLEKTEEKLTEANSDQYTNKSPIEEFYDRLVQKLTDGDRHPIRIVDRSRGIAFQVKVLDGADRPSIEGEVTPVINFVQSCFDEVNKSMEGEFILAIPSLVTAGNLMFSIIDVQKQILENQKHKKKLKNLDEAR